MDPLPAVDPWLQGTLRKVTGAVIRSPGFWPGSEDHHLTATSSQSCHFSSPSSRILPCETKVWLSLSNYTAWEAILCVGPAGWGTRDRFQGERVLSEKVKFGNTSLGLWTSFWLWIQPYKRIGDEPLDATSWAWASFLDRELGHLTSLYWQQGREDWFTKPEKQVLPGGDLQNDQKEQNRLVLFCPLINKWSNCSPLHNDCSFIPLHSVNVGWSPVYRDLCTELQNSQKLCPQGS